MKAPAMFLRRPETSMLIELLKDEPVGSEVSYAELSQHIGSNVQLEGNAYLTSARDFLKREGQVWGVIRGQGIKHLDDGERIQLSKSEQGSARRKASRSMKTALAVVDYESLDDAEKSEHQALVATGRLFVLMAGPRGQKRIKASLTVPEHERLPSPESIAALFAKRK